MIKVYIAAAVLIVVALALFEFGHVRYVAGEAHTQAQWDAQKKTDADALEVDRQHKQKDAESYAKQITDANDARDLARAQLDRIARAPHPQLVCHTAAPNDSGAVPGVPGSAGAAAAGHGQLPDNAAFDPSAGLYAEARRADEVVEECRDFYNRWPVPSEPAVPIPN